MLELFTKAGWVAFPLGLCSILAVAVMLERAITLMRLRQLEERAFMILQLAMEKGDDAAARDAAIASAPISQVMDSLREFRGAELEAIQQGAEIAVAVQRLRLRRYLGTLATIGSISPFIGLFGTVLGVMTAFQGMSQSGLSGETMAAGISEALSATALGLLVAVPAVIAYNYFLGRVQGLLLQIQGHVARLTPLLHQAPREQTEA
ncbi:MAG: MotA/TolQ/ExbB proton channel family protein [Armatimonadota bacterium]